MTPIVLLSAFCLAGHPAGSAADPACDPDTTVVAGGVRVYRWHSPRLIVISVPDTLRFVYDGRNGATVDSVARREGFRCAVNGSFFDGVRGSAVHAGWLSRYGHIETPLKTDPELTHVVRLRGNARAIDFVPAASFAHAENPGCVEFQTGPLVVERGTIRHDLIRAAPNGLTKHARTLIASCGRRRLFLVSVPEPVTLPEIASRLLRLSVFRGGTLDVINLDGGSSVSLYVRDVPGLSVNAEDRLPVLLGFP